MPIVGQSGVWAGKGDYLCRGAMLRRYHYFLAIPASCTDSWIPPSDVDVVKTVPPATYCFADPRYKVI